MDRRIFHGNIIPADVAQALMAEFNQGNLRTQLLGASDNLTIQIASSQFSRSGGKTALAVNVQRHEDGILVQVGEQQWLGVAASLGQTVIATVLNPFSLLNRLDDVAQDVSNLQLTEKIWQVVAGVVRSKGATTEISKRLSRLTCDYCGSANPVGEPACAMCGAPLGKSQPKSCHNCGYVIKGEEKFCPNCGQATN
jgi:hypothetical protein